MIGGFGTLSFFSVSFHGVVSTPTEDLQATLVAPFGEASLPFWAWHPTSFSLGMVSTIYKIEISLSFGYDLAIVSVARACREFSLATYASLTVEPFVFVFVVFFNVAV